MIAQWSEHWCAKPEALGSIPSCAAWIFPFLRPDVNAFFISTSVLGMAYLRLRLTVEGEVNNELPFMDVLLWQQHEEFIRSVFCEPALGFLCTNWSKYKSHKVTDLLSATGLLYFNPS